MAGMAVYSLCAADGLRHYSPHVWKVILALKHKGLDFDLCPVSFAEIPHIAGGGFSSVPVLDDHGRLEGDSFGIALYLEQVHGGNRLFPHEGQNALARMVEHFCDTVLNPPLSVIVVRQMHDMMSPADQDHFRAVRRKRFDAGIEEIAERSADEAKLFPQKLAPIRAVLRDQKWIAGNAPAFADHILFGSLQWHRICTGTSLFPIEDPVEQWFLHCIKYYGIDFSVDAIDASGCS